MARRARRNGGSVRHMPTRKSTMIKLAICAVLLSACATEPDTGTTTQGQCQLDPTTGMCPAPEVDYLGYTEEYGRSLYPTALQVDAGCAQYSEPGRAGCAVTLNLDLVVIHVTCEWNNGMVHCQVFYS